MSVQLREHERYGKLRFDGVAGDVPVTAKTPWLCDCGRRKDIRVCNVVRGASASCGMCSMIPIGSEKYGNLRIASPQDVHPRSDKKVAWICDCGRTAIAAVNHVLSGGTGSCGKCDLLPASFWEKNKFGSLRMAVPVDCHLKSNKKVAWTCDCGRTVLRHVHVVTRPGESSCGLCNAMSAMEVRDKRFGKLHMRSPKSVTPGSHEKTVWDCDCGGSVEASVVNVMSGNRTSCGGCTVLSLTYWGAAKFGRLRMKNPLPISPGSGKRVLWICECGNEKRTAVRVVFRGDAKSCGSCYGRASTWFFKNSSVIRNLSTPICPSDVPPGLMEVKSTIFRKKDKFPATCYACGDEYFPRWDNVRNGKSLTCGCVNSQSRAQSDIAQYVRSLGFDCVLEHEVGGFKYDLFIPSANLLVEYQGLKWHSSRDAKARDLHKYRIALQEGCGFLSIFEDEWVREKKKVKRLLRNRLMAVDLKGVRPSRTEIVAIPSRAANSFFSENHYIGPSRAKIYYGSVLDGKLISCAGFGCPTRQSRHEWELSRMASDGVHRVHGIWSKIVKIFVTEHSPSSIVSFSDNRLFTGTVYQNMGFVLDGELNPDYYWVKGPKRYHKSGLRKTDMEKMSGKTETELREAQGFSKIWDLGKKRWVLDCA